MSGYDQGFVRPGDIDDGFGFGLTPAGFIYCSYCGSLVLEGYRDAHRQWHMQLRQAGVKDGSGE